jgi:hypothetical protein
MKCLNLIIYSFLLIVLLSCNSKGVDRLEKTIFPYSELPIKVKQHIFTKDFIDLNKPAKFKKVSKQHRLFPWIYEIEIHRKKDSKIFKMKTLNGEYGGHLVIVNDDLYIPNHYNIY